MLPFAARAAAATALLRASPGARSAVARHVHAGLLPRPVPAGRSLQSSASTSGRLAHSSLLAPVASKLVPTPAPALARGFAAGAARGALSRAARDGAAQAGGEAGRAVAAGAGRAGEACEGADDGGGDVRGGVTVARRGAAGEKGGRGFAPPPPPPAPALSHRTPDLFLTARRPASTATAPLTTPSAAAAAAPPLLATTPAIAAGLAPHARTALAWWLGGCAAWVASMVALGGATRLTRSGLSMTDWKFTGERPPGTLAEWEVEFGKYKLSPEYKRVNRCVECEEKERKK